MLTPGKTVPALTLPLVGGGSFTLDDDAGEVGTLLVFYRGLHCPICIKQLKALEEKLDQFEEQGVKVVAISTDGEDRAKETVEKAAVSKLPVAYDLKLPAARFDWNLWISAAREGSSEPAHFSEPGLFFVLNDRTLYSAHVQSTPFARPQIDDILGMVKFRAEKDYPPRGAYDGSLDEAA